MQDLKQVVKRFYTACLNADSGEDIQSVMDNLLADDFHNINTSQSIDKTHFKEHVPGLFKMIPNLKCEIQEMLQDDNKVVVRSVVSGNPVGNFFGIETNGSKAFSIMAIDIHTVVNNQITSVYHQEEWTTAFQQLQS